MKKLCVIGCGVMGRTIVSGIVDSGLVASQDIIATTRSSDSAQQVRESLGIETTTDNRLAARKSRVILIALKPQILENVAGEFCGDIGKDAIIISIAAGKNIQTLEGYFSPSRKIIRAMPNIQALVREGISLLCGNGNVTPEDMGEALKIFRALGEVEEIPERLMNAAMALTSCSPAYVALFVEAMADAGVKLGLTRQQAFSLSGQAVCGAAKLLHEKKLHPATMKDMVCSPGGTTIEGVAVLEDNGFRGTVIRAIEAAARKAGAM